MRCLKLILARLGLATADMQVAIIKADLADIDRAITLLEDQRREATRRLAVATINAAAVKHKAKRLQETAA